MAWKFLVKEDRSDAVRQSLEREAKHLAPTSQLPMRFLGLLLLFTGAASAASMADLWHREAGVVHDDVEEDKSLGSASTTRSQHDHIAQIARGDVRSYTAVANESTNVEDLEKFVKSKIQPGQEGAIKPLTRDGKTFAWANLALDDAAKEEIAIHEGVLGIVEDLEVHNNRALPGKDWSQKLTRRAGKWFWQVVEARGRRSCASCGQSIPVSV